MIFSVLVQCTQVNMMLRNQILFRNITYLNRPDRVAQLAEHWASIPKVVGSIPTVDRHVFQASPVWIYTQSNITSIMQKNLKKTLTPMSHLWAQQHMVDRHYSLNLKPWSARTLHVYAQKYSVGLQEIFVSRLCSQEENYFFLPCLNMNLWLELDN